MNGITRIALFLLLTFLSFVQSASATDSLIYVDNRPYKLNFSDEFEGDTLDLTKWIPYYPHPYPDTLNPGVWLQDDHMEYSRLFHNFEDDVTPNNAVYLDRNVQVADGQCHVYTRRERAEWMGHVRGFSCGVMNSQKTDFGPGVYEMKAKLQSGYLMTYGYWLFGGTEEEKPTASEIDIFEFFNRKPHEMESNIYKWYNYKLFDKSNRKNKIKNEDWHTYRCVYDELTVRVYIDQFEKPVHTFYKYMSKSDGNPIDHTNYKEFPESDWDLQAYFPEVRHLLRLIIGGGVIRTPEMVKKKQWDNKKSPDQNTLDIEYVRYYQLAPQAVRYTP